MRTYGLSALDELEYDGSIHSAGAPDLARDRRLVIDHQRLGFLLPKYLGGLDHATADWLLGGAGSATARALGAPRGSLFRPAGERRPCVIGNEPLEPETAGDPHVSHWKVPLALSWDPKCDYKMAPGLRIPSGSSAFLILCGEPSRQGRAERAGRPSWLGQLHAHQ